jgi:predicted peptidase
MHRFIFLLSCFFLLSNMVQGQNTPLFDKLLYTNNNNTLPYRLLKPVNPGAKELFPLVVFLHGAGERGNDNEAQIKHISDLFLDAKYRGKYPCYVLAPQCAKGELWAEHNKDGSMKADPTPTMKLVLELIDKLCSEFAIDESRIYITGVSMGGFGAWDLMARFPDKFAAAVPVCGGGDAKTAGKIKHIPVWAFHGAKDDVVSPKRSRAMIKALQSVGGLPGYTEYPDIEHNSWVQAYQEPHLLPWLFKQKLPGTKTVN